MNDAAQTMPERAAAIRRSAARLCRMMGWSPLHEVRLANGRRADILALRGDGGFVCIEVKSGIRDFLTDQKWPEYLEFCDALYFAVDGDFPVGVLPEEAGLIVADAAGAEVLREAPEVGMVPARRRALLYRFAVLAANRLAGLEDPAGEADLRSALRAE